MELAVDMIGDVAIVVLPVDELTASNVGDFKRDIAPLLDTHTKMVLDLTRLLFADSAALGTFISCLRRLNAKGGDLKLCAMSQQVRDVFALVRLDRIFDIYATKAEAAGSYHR